MDINIRQTVSELINNINSNENISDALKEILCLLKNYNKLYNESLNSNLQNSKNDFEELYYFDILKLILNKYNISWENKNNDELSMGNLLKEIVIHGPAYDSLQCLFFQILHEKDYLSKLHLIEYLQELLEKNCIERILNKYSTICNFSSNLNSSDQLYIEELNKINQLIVSLPDKILVNKLLIDLTFFNREKYYNTIAYNILMSIHNIYKNLKDNKDCSVFPISNLLSKINSTGSSEIVWNYLIIHLSKNYEKEFLWRRIMQKIFSSINDSSINSLLHKVIKLIPDYRHLNYLLGNLPLDKKSMVLGFHRYIINCFEIKISSKILLYVGLNDELVIIYKDLFLKLLELWSDGNGVKKRSTEQNLYICKMIILCVEINKKKSYNFKEHKHIIGQYFLNGMPNYLSSLNSDVQEMGMFVAEHLTIYIDDGTSNLNFEINPTVISEQLNSMKIILDEKEPTEPSKIIEVSQTNNDQSMIYTNDIDSDDELPAFPNTTSNTKESPKYISDCLSCFIKSEDPNYVRECLLSIGKLVENQPEASETCVNLCKVLLHLEDKFSLDNFIQLKFNAMVALAINFPCLISNYLTGQFFEKEYSIRHRLDILDIISEAAVKLSSIEVSNEIVQSNNNLHVRDENISNWRQIVDKRIELKTRRFCSSSSSHNKSLKKNIFVNIAGSFFYPLMKDFDKKINCLDIVGRDYIIAQKLLFTLSCILNCSVNAPDIGHMAASLIEFSLCFKVHSEPGVIMSLLCCLGSAIMALNQGTLLEYIEDYIDQIGDFLLYILTMENTECIMLALEVQHLLNVSIKQHAVSILN